MCIFRLSIDIYMKCNLSLKANCAYDFSMYLKEKDRREFQLNDSYYTRKSTRKEPTGKNGKSTMNYFVINRIRSSTNYFSSSDMKEQISYRIFLCCFISCLRLLHRHQLRFLGVFFPRHSVASVFGYFRSTSIFIFKS